MTFTLDVNGLAQLTASFIIAGQKVQKGAPAIVSKGALNIKTQMRDELKESPHFKGVVPAVTYDRTATATSVEAEIGPVIGKAAGSLAFIAAFGTADTPAWWDFTKALRDEEDDFVKYLTDLAVGAL